jgi:hypothetical protein
MPTREEVFEELGLMPVYVRKGYVPTQEKAAIPAAQITRYEQILRANFD